MAACALCSGRVKDHCSALIQDIPGLTPDHAPRHRQFEAGQEIFRVGSAGDSIYNLLDGWVLLEKYFENGGRQILSFLLPGAVLGLHPNDGPRSAYSARALTDATVCALPHEGLAALIRQYPETGLRLAQTVSRDRDLAYDHLASVGRQSARERVAHLLTELFIRSRHHWPDHDIDDLHLPLSQEHIADATGLSPVHVNRVLRLLREDGVIRFRHRMLAVLDPDALVALADADSKLLMSWAKD